MDWADKSERRTVFETDLDRRKSVNKIKTHSNDESNRGVCCWSDILPLLQSHVNSFPNAFDHCVVRQELQVPDRSGGSHLLSRNLPENSKANTMCEHTAAAYRSESSSDITVELLRHRLISTTLQDIIIAASPALSDLADRAEGSK